MWRNGFTIDSGCALQTSGFLPQQVTLDIYGGAGGNPAMVPTGGNNVWWSWDQYTNYTTWNSAFGGDYTVINP